MSKHGTPLSIGQFSELAGAVIKALPRDIDPDVALNWANNGAALKKALRDALCPTVKGRPKSTLALIKTTSLGGSKPQKTKACFTSAFWHYRDSDIDSWFPKEQAEQEHGSVGIYQVQDPKGTTFREMAVAAIQAVPGTSDDEIVTWLKRRGLTLTLPQVEVIVERQENGEDTGLGTDGYANFAFVEDAHGDVSVLDFRRGGRRWEVYVHRLGDESRWHAGSRFLLRNSDTRIL